jgi:hypothetical protein
MLHACLFTICFVFCYTSWCFYAFSRTKVLTRCHSASPYFCYFCVSEKLYRKYSRNWTKQKPNLLFFPKRHEIRRWDEGGPEARLTLGWRGLPLACATRGWDHLVHLLTPPLLPIYSPQREKPKGRTAFPWNILQATAVAVVRSGGSRSSSQHPAGEHYKENANLWPSIFVTRSS